MGFRAAQLASEEPFVFEVWFGGPHKVKYLYISIKIIF